MAAKKAPKKATKKSSVKKPSATPARKLTAAKTPMTKSAMMDEIAGQTGSARKQVLSVLNELGVLIERHIRKGAAGQFTLPGLMRRSRSGVSPPRKRGRVSTRLQAWRHSSKPNPLATL